MSRFHQTLTQEYFDEIIPRVTLSRKYSKLRMDELIEGLTPLVKVWIKKYENIEHNPACKDFYDDHPPIAYSLGSDMDWMLSAIINLEFCKLKLGQS